MRKPEVQEVLQSVVIIKIHGIGARWEESKKKEGIPINGQSTVIIFQSEKHMGDWPGGIWEIDPYFLGCD